MHDLFDLFSVEETPEVNEQLQEALDKLQREVDALPLDFLDEPDLTTLAMAVQDVLMAAGRPSRSAQAWVLYENSHRASSKLEEARSRAEAFYLQELDSLKRGRRSALEVEGSDLPWRQPRQL